MDEETGVQAEDPSGSLWEAEAEMGLAITHSDITSFLLQYDADQSGRI